MEATETHVPDNPSSTGEPIPSDPSSLREWARESRGTPSEETSPQIEHTAEEATADPIDLRTAVREAAERRRERQASEAEEAAAYEAAAGIEPEREIPEETSPELDALREIKSELESLKQPSPQPEPQSDPTQAQQAANAYNEWAQAIAQADTRTQHQVRDALLQNFPELGSGSPEEVAAFQQTNPYRYAEAVEFATRADNTRKGEIARMAIQQQANLASYSQAYRELGQVEDNKFIENHPELKDPGALKKAQAMAFDYCRNELGLSDQEIHDGWTLGVGRAAALRHAGAQEMLLAAVRQKEGRRMASEAVRESQRQKSRLIPPGTLNGGPADTPLLSEIRQLRAKRDSSGFSIREAAKLSGLERRYREGRQ
jgi:hypothetical protein